MDVSQTSLPTEPSHLVFRAVMVKRRRRGIRLEQGYWDALADITTRERIGLGELILEFERRYPDLQNLTAAIRLGVLERLMLDARVAKASLKTITATVAACPSPAFALSGSRQFITYNTAFLSFLQARLSPLSAEAIGSGLKFQLEIPFETLVERLAADPQNPVPSNYTIIAHDRSLRGRINAVLAYSKEGAAVVGYLIN
ncbi:MAG: ribbon-helix-helix domain-containing protein [Allorhizobium sp.]